MLKNFIKDNFMKQNMMRTVIISLLPLIIASIFFFGWRSLVLLIWVSFFGVMTEYIFEKKSGKKNPKVSEAVFVTSILYVLTLPARTPLWIAAVGIIFGVIFGKQVFGGFGRNIFNPALVARAFVYVSFPEPFTIEWTKGATSLPGGFSTYLMSNVDNIARATPMLQFRETGDITAYKNLITGLGINGSLGETSSILIIFAGIYLVYKKVASWEIMAGVSLGFLGLSSVLYFMGNTQVPNPLFGILSGGFLFGMVFMATDPISSAKTREGKWIYGILIGIVTVIIRGYALFAGGMMFAILIGNTFAPIIDETVRYTKKRKSNRSVEI